MRSKRARDDDVQHARRHEDVGWEEETDDVVIQHMVKRLRVHDSKSPSPDPFQQQSWQQQQMSLNPLQQSHQATTQYHPMQSPMHHHPQDHQAQLNSFQQQQQQQGYQDVHHQIHNAEPRYASTQQIQYNSNLSQTEFPTMQQPQQQQQRQRRQQQFIQQQQASGQNSEEQTFLSPMNRLLGSLHQQRRLERQHGDRCILPTNTQLY
jgi:hypothetical protein